MLMQQVREVMTVNQEMTDESCWIWLTSEQDRRIMLDLANVGADGVSVAVRICE